MWMKAWMAAAMVSAALCMPAHANVVVLNGDTTGDPTYTRAFEDFSAPSPVGVGVHYDPYTLSVSAPGAYSFLTTGAFDTFLFLYSAFNPANPLSGGIIANDDLAGFTSGFASGFTATLAAGTPYTLVVTGYQSSDFGAHTTTISGPGVIAVPEPAHYVLLAIGLAAIAQRRRVNRREA